MDEKTYTLVNGDEVMVNFDGDKAIAVYCYTDAPTAHVPALGHRPG
jgi:hypothetical protein